MSWRGTQLCGAVLLAVLAAGCRQDMHDQPKIEPLEASRFFLDQQGARPLPDGTVARGELREDDAYWRGRGPDGKLLRRTPVAVDEALVRRGRERYDIFCSPCHGRLGDGLGMIVQRGFKQPVSFHEQRLREIEDGYVFDVITNGFGMMSSYASQVPVADRWAIVEWVRVLQLSGNVPIASLTPDERARLERGAKLDEPATEDAEGEHDGH